MSAAVKNEQWVSKSSVCRIFLIKCNQSASEIKRIRVFICVDRGGTIWHCSEAKTCTTTVELQAGSFKESQAQNNSV